MGLTVRPAFRLLANRQDITALIESRLVSLRYTDVAGLAADMLEIVLADHDAQIPIEIPAPGAELELSMGDEAALQYVGVFVTDEVEVSGWPGQLCIRARAAPFAVSRSGLSPLHTQKSRTWAAGTRLADVVQAVAAEHGMQAAVAKGLGATVLAKQTQLDESDLGFLVRLAQYYDAIVKPVAGRLVLAPAGQSKSVSGQQLPPVHLHAGDVSRYRVSWVTREDGGSIIAGWHDVQAGQHRELTVGEGEPVTRLRAQYASEDMARAAAQAEHGRRARRKARLSLGLPGRPDVVAEGCLVLSGFRQGVDGRWCVTRAEHALDDSGYVTTVDAEQVV